MSIRVEHADSREVLKTLADCSVASVVTDPPYALVSITKRFGKEGAAAVKPGKTGAYARASAGFMGKQWDTGQTAFDPAFWEEVYRVLKPGGHVLAFGGTRTYHRLVCAIEDAGFEVRDTIGWLFGSGFPKSHNVAKGIDRANGDERPVLSKGDPVKRMIPGADQNKAGWEKNNGREYVPTETAAASAASAAWEGWGTALKPAMELICVGRRPLIGTVAQNVLEHGAGAINIDGCRIETADDLNGGAYAEVGARGVSNSLHADTGMNVPGKTVGKDFVQPLGRWPANVIHDGSAEVVEAFPNSAGQLVDASSSSGRKSQNVYGAMKRGNGRDGEASADRRYAEDGSTDFAALPGARRGDSGSAARFFYSSKADAADRLESKHPTVKPVDLMRYLVRLVTPPGGLVLDPFAGSGTTGMACMAEGFDALLIEREAEYVADIRRRIAHVSGAAEGELFAGLA